MTKVSLCASTKCGAHLLTLALGVFTPASITHASVQTKHSMITLLVADTFGTAKSEREAAQLASARYGGKVLRVQRRNQYFEVRLLLDDGRVKHVNIPAHDASGKS